MLLHNATANRQPKPTVGVHAGIRFVRLMKRFKDSLQFAGRNTATVIAHTNVPLTVIARRRLRHDGNVTVSCDRCDCDRRAEGRGMREGRFRTARVTS